jgi:tetratricopeptide (TPR) repeat protein
VYLAQRDPGGAPAGAGQSAPPPPPAAAAPVPLHEPKLGLATIEQLHDPQSSSVSSLHSESLWITTRADFEDACKQPNAPVRWCAARELADGEAALAVNDQQRAGAAFERAAERDPTWAMPLVGTAGVLTARKDLPGALAAAGQAQRLEPTWWQAVAAGGRAYAGLGKMDDAIQEYRRALALAPKNPILIAEIALAYHASQMDAEALKYGDQALAMDDNIVTVHLMRAELALERADVKRALVETERVLAISPKNPGGHLARGDAFALQWKKAEAFEEYRHVVELVGDNTSSVPDKRFTAIKEALAKNRLPPPRGKAVVGDTGSRSKPAGPKGLDNRSRPGCNAGDPLCATDL